MATSVTSAARAAARPPANALARVVQWIKSHRQATGYLVALLLIATVLFAWNLLSAKSAEENAGRQLTQGRLALASKNYPLAASVLAQLVENYAGTRAAQEGSIALAQVRLAQGQNQLAIDVLQRFAPRAGRDYQAQAYGLLGAAYENVARSRDAAEAYGKASHAAPFPFLGAQFLSDAARAWLAAGDTAPAIAAYRTIIQQFDSTSAVGEAKVRLGELTQGTVRLAP